MHELGITRSIVDIVREQAQGAAVTRVRLAIGELSAVIPEALHFCFQELRAGTELEGAELEIESVAGRARCEDCGAAFAMPVTGARCHCGGWRYRLLAGDELTIREIDVREAE